jgi:hypothetical protein
LSDGGQIGIDPARSLNRVSLFGAAAIRSKGDKGITEPVLDPFAQDNPAEAGKSQIRLFDLAHVQVEHSGEVMASSPFTTA